MSGAAAHDMRGAETGATWPPLGQREVREVLRRWNLDDAGTRIAWHSPRPLSSAGIVEAGQRTLFLKRHHHSIRTPAQLQEEHGFMRYLKTRGAPVCEVVAAGDGASTAAIGDWTYEIHSLGTGVDLYREAVSWSPLRSREHAFAAGRALGLFHRSAEGFAAAPRAAYVLVSNDRVIRDADPLRAVRELIELRPALRQYFTGRNWPLAIGRALEPFHAQFREASRGLDSLWTHNDWHASNLLWSDGDSEPTVTTVLDFGLSDRTTAVYDLATAIERNTIPWLDIHEGIPAPADLGLVSALVNGYRSARPLSAHEREALVAALPLVHVGYALAEIDYFQGSTHSVENADLAYEAFLIGHCGWFESDQGRSLLRHLDRVAGEGMS
jgi:Ser/Thr protein kinase RdoA (MazF antagonist)